MRNINTFFVFFLISSKLLFAQDRPFVYLQAGMEIHHSLRIVPSEYNFYLTDFRPIVIEGEDLVIDLGASTLWGSDEKKEPHLYKDTAIIIRNSKNIRLENVSIHRFEVAIYIENSEDIYIRKADLSYGKRNWLWSSSGELIKEDETLTRLEGAPAAIKMHQVKNIVLDKLRIHHSQAGIKGTDIHGFQLLNSAVLFSQSQACLLVNSSQIRIAHNYLDHHYTYASGQLGAIPSEGTIVCRECSDVFELLNNSITHGFNGLNYAAQSISSKDSRILVSGNEFKWQFNSAVIGTDSKIELLNNHFEELRTAISLRNTFALIKDNEFKHHASAILFENNRQLHIEGNHFYDIEASIVALSTDHGNSISIINNCMKQCKSPFEGTVKGRVEKKHNRFLDFTLLRLWNTSCKNRKSNAWYSSNVNSYPRRQRKKYNIRAISDATDACFSPPLTNEYPEDISDYQWTRVWPWPEKAWTSMRSSYFGPTGFGAPTAITSYHDGQCVITLNGPEAARWEVPKSLDSEKHKGVFPDQLLQSETACLEGASVSFTSRGSRYRDYKGAFVDKDDNYLFYGISPKNATWIRPFRFKEEKTENHLASKILSPGTYSISCLQQGNPYLTIDGIAVDHLPVLSDIVDFPIYSTDIETRMEIYWKQADQNGPLLCRLFKYTTE